MSSDDFYEDDESAEDIILAFEHGEQGVTYPPDMDLWVCVDGRTGERVGVATFLNEASGWRAIAEWLDRQARGVRPDLSRELLENLTIRRR